MHELAIAEELLRIVLQELEPWGAGARVRRVRVRIGQLSGVVPEALRFAFEAIAQGGPAEGASLELEEVPFRVRCGACGAEGAPEGPFLLCPRCGGPQVEVISGRELELASMEVDHGGEGRSQGARGK